METRRTNNWLKTFLQFGYLFKVALDTASTDCAFSYLYLCSNFMNTVYMAFHWSHPHSNNAWSKVIEPINLYCMGTIYTLVIASITLIMAFHWSKFCPMVETSKYYNYYYNYNYDTSTLYISTVCIMCVYTVLHWRCFHLRVEATCNVVIVQCTVVRMYLVQMYWVLTYLERHRYLCYNIQGAPIKTKHQICVQN